MFKFNFNQQNEHNNLADASATSCFEDETSKKEKSAEKETNVTQPGQEINLDERHRTRAESYRENGSLVFNKPFHIVDLKHVQQLIDEKKEGYKNLSLAIELDSDVIKGVYEGGLKVWECTLDLLSYMEKESIHFEGKEVLDLGCGAGLLGIHSLNHGSSSTHFQDYNSDVLDLVTIPNVLLNCSSEDVQSKTRYFAGDWESLIDMLDHYDIILTAETIYNPASYSKLLKLFDKALKPNGVIFVAAKQHYFGVGGNLREFEHLLRQNERWDTSICFSSEEGVKREILRIAARRHMQES